MVTRHLQGQTYHARRGGIRNAFRYGVDYVLCDLDDPQEDPALLSRNRFNLWSLHSARHGGPRGDGTGTAWFRGELERRGFPLEGAELLLLTQPSFLWFHFNPVSFWIALRDGQPFAFVAEVNNTFGGRHCYFCAHEDFRPIRRDDRLVATKLMHVSPFQEVAGRYIFNFGMSATEVHIRIAYENGKEGVLATLDGPLAPATNRSLARAALRRPMGALRVLALIHWQAVILWIKRAPFLSAAPAPEPLTSDNEHAKGATP
ncbi:cyclopropane-fatty-acyl-phospholipid synthase [Oceanicola sp. 22II-s10i]|uniref:DUF1365 domain-containing protein n=1 Tax=Oceanicola sp. 22II-s10i TaxID=1317116 RepID=UPI000B525C34|nr:DUF1365 domain-containing protein [Oceanicola sp. 22II-s10i]OWU83384.1 cyclopropane-fatty-acyl-phospholipid synthase [Oceanicola sp. 22II-s10i]